jgi:hypothetical protein
MLGVHDDGHTSFPPLNVEVELSFDPALEPYFQAIASAMFVSIRQEN